MKRRIRVTLLIVVAALVALLVAVGATAAVGTARFRRQSQREKLELVARGASGAVLERRPISSLPPPVQRYLEVTRSAEAPAFKIATLAQRGRLRSAADKPWMSFEAEQVYSVEPPGFIWGAEASVWPLIHMLARDRYVDGEGRMQVNLAGLLNVADGRGPEMDLGAGLRYWGEVIAFPEIVRSPYLSWEAIDELHARLHAVQGSLNMTAVVAFAADGLPSTIRADRYRDVEGRPVLTPWSGLMADWSSVGGRLFPRRWTAVWHLPEGDLPVVEIEVTSVRVA